MPVGLVEGRGPGRLYPLFLLNLLASRFGLLGQLCFGTGFLEKVECLSVFFLRVSPGLYLGADRITAPTSLDTQITWGAGFTSIQRQSAGEGLRLHFQEAPVLQIQVRGAPWV